MKIKEFVLLALIGLCQISKAQWIDHYSYNGALHVGVIDNKAVVCNSAALYTYDIETLALDKYSNVNGYLSDSDISAFLCDGTNAYIGYTDGNIDILNLNTYTTNNIPELRITENISSKEIHAFHKDGNTLYCGFDEGILEVNINKAEISSRYIIRRDVISVNSIASDDKYIYASTNSGIFYAYKTSNILEDPSEWTLLANKEASFCKLYNYNSQIIAAEGAIGDTCLIERIVDADSMLCIAKEPYFREFFYNDEYWGIASDSTISIYNKENNQVAKLTSYKFSNGTNATLNVRGATFFNNKNLLAIADNTSNLVICDLDGNASNYLPNGPYSNECFELKATKYAVYSTRGGMTEGKWSESYTPSQNTTFLNILKNGTWEYKEQQHWYKDAIRLSIDSNNDDIYLACYIGGILHLNRDGVEIEGFNHYNSPIKTSGIFPMIMSITHDNNGNAIMFSILNTPALHVYNNGTWNELNYPYTNDRNASYDMICTSSDHIWFIMKCCLKPGVFIFDTNGTIDDDSDDKFKSPVSYPSDSRYCGLSYLMDEENEIIGDGFVNTVTEDNNGVIWIGTNDGIATYEDDANVFEVGDMRYNRIKVPRNDGSGLADYLLSGESVTAIAVDGANRKWIGTLNSGVFFVSADGTSTIASFDTSNSPLPSNEINSIAIHPTTGEVFIGTRNGIIGYKGDATEPSDDMNELTISPNPVRPDFSGIVRIKGFEDGSIVTITDIRGRLVHRGISNGGMLTWDTIDLDGNKVSTGTYLIYASSADGKSKTSGKLLIIR